MEFLFLDLFWVCWYLFDHHGEWFLLHWIVAISINHLWSPEAKFCRSRKSIISFGIFKSKHLNPSKKEAGGIIGGYKAKHSTFKIIIDEAYLPVFCPKFEYSRAKKFRDKVMTKTHFDLVFSCRLHYII